MDTGRAGDIGAISMDKVLGLSYFAKHGLLPRGYKKEGLHTWPARDYSNVSPTGSVTDDKSALTVADSNGDENNLGWNFGANKSRALIIVGNTQTRRHRSLLNISDGQPSDYNLKGAKSIVFVNERFNFNYYVGSTVSASGFTYGLGITMIGGLDQANFQQNGAPRPTAMALYVDTVGDLVKAFLRFGMAEWFHFSASNAHLAAVRCAGILAAPETTSVVCHTPVGVYAE